MRYPEFAAAALPVGSGMVEGACKQVVQARQKHAGRRWRSKGAQWAAFWARHPHMRRPTARDLISHARANAA